MRTSMVARTILAALILAAAAGCGAATTAQSTAKPTVRIISPVNGAKLSSQTLQDVTVHLAISHFILVAGPAGPEQAGQVWIYENGQAVRRSGSSTVSLTLTPGSYTLKAVLVANGKPVAESAPVVVSVPNPVSCAHTPFPSTGLKAGSITLFCRGLPAGGLGSLLVAGPGGDLWFTLLAVGGRPGIGRITPTGTITTYSKGLPVGAYPLENPATVGPGDNLWFAVNRDPSTGGTGRIARVTPTGAITLFSAGLPATAVLGRPIVGPGGNLWFPIDAPIAAIGQMTPSGTITVFRTGLPSSNPIDRLVVGPDGNVWFTLQSGSGIGRITPTGVVTMFSKGLPSPQAVIKTLTNPTMTCGMGPACGVFRLVPGPGGDLWFIYRGLSAIGRITPGGTITIYSNGLPANDYPYGTLTVGAGGNLWFLYQLCSSVQGGCVPASPPGVGRITPSGTITIFSHGLPAGSSVGTLVTGPGGDLWFPVNPTSSEGTGSIGRITPSGVITLFSHGLPAGGGAGNLVNGPDGNLWFLISVNGATAIGRITPSGAITVFNSQALAAGSGGGNGPSRLVVGPDGNLWFILGSGTAIGRIIP